MAFVKFRQKYSNHEYIVNTDHISVIDILFDDSHVAKSYLVRIGDELDQQENLYISEEDYLKLISILDVK